MTGSCFILIRSRSSQITFDGECRVESRAGGPALDSTLHSTLLKHFPEIRPLNRWNKIWIVVCLVYDLDLPHLHHLSQLYFIISLTDIARMYFAGFSPTARTATCSFPQAIFAPSLCRRSSHQGLALVSTRR